MDWTKSSYSGSNGDCVEWKVSSRSAYNGACVQVADGSAWAASSRSLANGNCVETAQCPHGRVLVRDSKKGEASPVLRFRPAAWREFTSRVRLLP